VIYRWFHEQGEVVEYGLDLEMRSPKDLHEFLAQNPRWCTALAPKNKRKKSKGGGRTYLPGWAGQLA
jgi:hypothetical protein